MFFFYKSQNSAFLLSTTEKNSTKNKIKCYGSEGICILLRLRWLMVDFIKKTKNETKKMLMALEKNVLQI